MAQAISTFAATSGVFPGQSALSSIDLTDAGVNGGNIALTDDGSEVIFNLLNHFHDTIQEQPQKATNVKLTSSTSSQIQGDELVKQYVFNVRLDFGAGDVASLNVADETGD